MTIRDDNQEGEGEEMKGHEVDSKQMEEERR